LKPRTHLPRPRWAIPLKLALAALAVAVTTTEAQVINLATVAPDRSVWVKTLRAAAAEATTATEGRLKFKVYPGGVQGDEQTVLRKMRVGQLQGAAFMGQGVRLICPDATVLQLPLMFRSEAEVGQSLADLDADLRAAARQNRVELIAWTRQGFAYLYSRPAVTDLDSLRKAKPWLVPEDQFAETLFRAAAVSGISVPVSDVLTGLQSGLIDTIYSPPLVMVTMQWHTRVVNKLDIGLAYSIGALVLTDVAWNRLNEGDRATVKAIFARRLNELNLLVRKQNEDADAVMAKQVQTLTPTSATLAEFRQLNDTVTKQLIGKAYSAAIERKLQESLARQRERK
jgi:TRAP-type C4-dicarboxylate transport system substrate-binding protein